MKNKKLSPWPATTFMIMTLILSSASQASAAIIFQDDSFHEIESNTLLLGSGNSGTDNTAIQFGADTITANNGNIQWDVINDRFNIDHTVNITGGFEAAGQVNFSDSNQVRLRESSDPNTLADCSSIGEVIINTSSNKLMICTALGTPGTWVAMVADAADFEAIYSADADGALSTAGGNFDVNTANGNITNTTGTGTYSLTSLNTTASAINLAANTGAGGITMNAGTGGLNFATTGIFSFTGNDNASITTSGATSNIALTAGKDIIFDDSKLTSAIKLSSTATGWASTLTANGIIDNINSFTSTIAGEGASNVGLESGSLVNVTPSSDNVQVALVALDAVVGSGAPNTEDLSFFAQYPNSTIFRDGSNNSGTLANEYDYAGNMQYYHWTSNNANLQDMDIRFRFALPADFISAGNFKYNYRTGTTVSTDNNILLSVTNSTNLTAGVPTVCSQAATNTTANVWSSGTLSAASINTGCTGATALNAGDIVQVIVKLFDRNGASTFADIGNISFGYSN